MLDLTADQVFLDWEHYPSNLSQTFPGDDLSTVKRRFEANSDRLFSDSITSISFRTVLPPELIVESSASTTSDVLMNEADAEEVILVRDPSHKDVGRLPYSQPRNI